ncbi:SAP190 [[Candida] subhashii]|uniref:SAP190 n=1 Tax=[Candida] subhashii TaxID=561895 RepID=A0A8J5UIT0_9ASCO|nr:SAP190 [[Candida] subhashii]KAG7660436.1 SAP190 [[Candida] subhashii]
MSGSFWKFSNGFTSLSNISTLLENHAINQESGDTSSGSQSSTSSYDVLLKLLDENDLLQELLSNNPMLLEFLREENVLSMLVDLVINEGEELLEKDKEETSKETPHGSDESDKKETTHDDSDEVEKDKKELDDDDDDYEDEKEEEDEEEEEEEESPEDRANRRATIAAEILSADVWSLTDTVMESIDNLNKLWSILNAKEPLSISLSTFFMKIMEHLLDMKCDEMISYLVDNQSNLVEKFMNHLSNPPLMDFLLKLISTDKPDSSTGIIHYLQNQDLITHLINALDVDEKTKDLVHKSKNENEKEEQEEEGEEEDYDMLLVRQSSAADFLKALITISANSTTDNSTIGPNELTRELVSLPQMTRLCDIMLKGGYALANGVGIIIEIIRKNNSDYDILPVLYVTLESHPPTGRDPIYLGHLLRVFGERINEFNKILIKEDLDSKLRTPFGEIEPLGFERFKICELIAELLHCSNMALLNDNRGFDIVKERDELRLRMKEYDPISFKYNEIMVLPDDENKKDKSTTKSEDNFNDTIEEFNNDQDDSIRPDETTIEDEDAPHANSNLTEEQIRSNPVVGDFLKIALFDTQIISNILTMFFRFPWNNFLHNVVFDIVQQVLNGSMDIGFNKYLAIDLFDSGDITNKIIEGQKLCTDYELSHNGLRLGFMGHLTLIAEEVVKFIQLYPANSLSELIDVKVDQEVWEDYVSNVLYDTREKYNAILGGNDEPSEDEDEDESNTFDEGLGELIGELKIDNFNSSANTGDFENLFAGQDEDDDEDEEEEREVQLQNTTATTTTGSKKKYLLDSDESGSDDDDHFSNYMSQQLSSPTAATTSSHHHALSGSGNAGKVVHGENDGDDDDELETSSDDDDIIIEDVTNTREHIGNPVSHLEFEANDDDDEYIDPNDDGLSYKKSHPLYDSTGSLINSGPVRLHRDDLKGGHDEEDDDDDLSSEDSDSGGERDMEEEEEDELLAFDEEAGSKRVKLTRAASKG